MATGDWLECDLGLRTFAVSARARASLGGTQSWHLTPVARTEPVRVPRFTTCDVLVQPTQSRSARDVRVVECPAGVRLRRHTRTAGQRAGTRHHACLHATIAQTCEQALSVRRDHRSSKSRCHRPASQHRGVPGRGQSWGGAIAKRESHAASRTTVAPCLEGTPGPVSRRRH